MRCGAAAGKIAGTLGITGLMVIPQNKKGSAVCDRLAEMPNDFTAKASQTGPNTAN